jgi:hypothetical protein
VRTNWKSKNFNPNDDPTKQDSSTDESELEARERAENGDRVDTMSDDWDKSKSPTKSNRKKSDKLSTAESQNQLIDLTASPDHPSSRPTVEMQLETLNNIRLYNKALPKKR